MKQLDDLLKRLEALEARIAKLESGAPPHPKQNPQTDGGGKISTCQSGWL